MKLRACLFLALFALPAALAQDAEEKKTEGPQMDAISKKLLEDWRKSEYHLGRAGVKKASCTTKLNMTRGEQSMSLSITYKWDGDKSTLDFDNPQMGAAMNQGGGMARQFEERFKSEDLMKSFGSAKLTAKESEQGTVVAVTGKAKGGITSFTFNKEGVVTEMTADTPSRMGGTVPVKITPTYEKVDGMYFRTGQTVEAEVPGMGKIISTTKITYVKVGSFRPVKKSETSTTAGGMPAGSRSFEYSDWKFNEEVDKKEESKPAEGCG
ncbi:MAG: hypothetical protein ACYTGV_06170 [Planctomycetota bacterium]|jgi:hypothetical protein